RLVGLPRGSKITDIGWIRLIYAYSPVSLERCASSETLSRSKASFTRASSALPCHSLALSTSWEIADGHLPLEASRRCAGGENTAVRERTKLARVLFLLHRRIVFHIKLAMPWQRIPRRRRSSTSAALAPWRPVPRATGFPHRLEAFLDCHQWCRLQGLCRPTGCKGKGERGCTDIVGHLSDGHHVVLPKGIVDTLD